MDLSLQNITKSTNKCMIKNMSLWTLVSVDHDRFVSTTYYVSDVSIFKLQYIDYHYCKKGVQQKEYLFKSLINKLQT